MRNKEEHLITETINQINYLKSEIRKYINNFFIQLGLHLCPGKNSNYFTSKYI